MVHLKRSITQALESNDLESIVSQAKHDRKVLSQLVRIAYDKETLIGWRAIIAIGLAARELVNSAPGFLREMTRKLLWSLSDESGAIGWSAPEILGEIVSAHPERFRDIVPLIVEVYDIEEKTFRPGIVYALRKIAEPNPAVIMPFKDIVFRALSDDNPLVRVRAIEMATTVKSSLSEADLATVSRVIEDLSADRAEVWIYQNSDFVNIQVGEAANQFKKD